jgi:hypothetical protein
MPTKHVFFARSSGDREAFTAAVFERTIPAVRQLSPGPLKVGLTDAPNPKRSLVPLRRKNLLMVSVWGEIDAGEVARALDGPGVEVFGYRVDESIPIKVERAWRVGERGDPPPGVVLLTLLARSPRLDRDEFLAEWHGVHTPKAMRIHPMWGYVRNVIEARLPEASPEFEGVVEEHYRERADVLNPVRMFGGALRFVPNTIEILRHVRHFLDLQRTENYLLSEWILAE